MKTFFLISAILISFLFACNNGRRVPEAANIQNLQFYGDTINQEGAIPSDQIAQKLSGMDSATIKTIGSIESVCQKKGCWMKMDIGNNQTMQVRFKDYGFFVPKDVSGKKAVIEGIAFKSTTPVDELRHYAEDAGKSKEEIEKITEPETSIGFEAHGVIIEN